MLTTPRLTIRPWRNDDLPHLKKLAKDPGYLNFASPGFLQFQNENEAAAYLKQRVDRFKETRLGKFPMFLRVTGECVGTCGFDPYLINGGEAIELGYRVTLKQWYQGYATEAAQALVDYAFTDLDRENVFAFALEQNRGSLKVLQKLSFTPRGTLVHAENEHLLFEKKRGATST